MSEKENPQWERALLEKLAQQSAKEQRAARRWGVFFRLLFWGYVLGITAFVLRDTFITADEAGSEGHAALVSMSGVIDTENENAARRINALLRRAFENDEAKGVILRINSPGGSPVQSHMIFKEIRRLRESHPDKKIYAAIEDIGASGGYFIAAAADEIYADEASLVGSIGAVYRGFGFVGALEKLGVERRVVAAGNNKNALDPFLPRDVQEESRMRGILSEVHEVFIGAVKEGRGEKLAAGVFDGDLFGGRESVRLGLVDGLGDVDYIARELVQAEIVEYTHSPEDLLSLALEQWGAMGRALVGFAAAAVVGASGF